jgi:hypothetical protein
MKTSLLTRPKVFHQTRQESRRHYSPPESPDARFLIIEQRVEAAHYRLDRVEAQPTEEGMFVTFHNLMPGFTRADVQAKFFRHVLYKLLAEFKVK